MIFRRFLLAAALASGLVGMASAQCHASFSLVNRSAATINEFYFESSAQRSWGVDQLGTNVLTNGATSRFQARNPSRNDLRVV